MRMLLALNQPNTQAIEKLIWGSLFSGDDVTCVSNQNELLEVIGSQSPDLLIYNRYFPGDMPAIDVLKTITQSAPQIRIIFLVGKLDEKACADYTVARMMGIEDIVVWEEETCLPATELLQVITSMVINFRGEVTARR